MDTAALYEKPTAHVTAEQLAADAVDTVALWQHKRCGYGQAADTVGIRLQ